MNMSGYTKLFNSILASTIWREDDKTRIVWITMLAMAGKNGEVEASVPGLADFARVSIEDCQKALKKLKAPDEHSRCKANEGRRISEIEGGWLILNHEKYREKMNEDQRREYNRIKQAERRQRLSANVSIVNDKSALSAQADSDTDSDTVQKRESAPSVLPLPQQCQAVVTLWNSTKLPKCSVLNESRRRKLVVRLNDPFFSANWETAVQRILESRFCMGENDRGWQATFDWFLQPDTVPKVMEGKYANRKGTGGKVNERNIGVPLDPGNGAKIRALVDANQ